MFLKKYKMIVQIKLDNNFVRFLYFNNNERYFTFLCKKKLKMHYAFEKEQHLKIKIDK